MAVRAPLKDISCKPFDLKIKESSIHVMLFFAIPPCEMM